MLYWPVPSVATERTFSISTELDASTVTPGSTAPDASLTIPAIVPVLGQGPDRREEHGQNDQSPREPVHATSCVPRKNDYFVGRN